MSSRSLVETLQRVTNELRQRNCTFALAGGLLVSGYREDVRATNDIDILLLLGNRSEETAHEILELMGMKKRIVKIHDLKRLPKMNKKGEPAAIIVGRAGEQDVGIDFILPEMPWFESAIKRAQANQLDFGFGEIPCITLEDMIIAKLYAGRDKDLDDLKSMFAKNKDMDFAYLISQALKHGLSVPKAVRDCMPRELQKVFRKKRPA